MLVPTLTASLLLGLCAAHIAVAGPVKVPTPQQELQAIYNKINAAAAQKDVDGVFDYNASDYVTTNTKGRTHDASDGRQELQDVMSAVDMVQGTTSIKTFTGTATDAAVTVKDHYVFIASNQSTRRTIKFASDDVSRDYWVKTDDGWRRKRTRILSGKIAFRKNF